MFSGQFEVLLLLLFNSVLSIYYRAVISFIVLSSSHIQRKVVFCFFYVKIGDIGYFISLLPFAFSILRYSYVDDNIVAPI